MITKKTDQDIIAEAISGSQTVQYLDPKEIRTEKPMVLSRHPAETVMHFSSGKIPLDAKRVKAMTTALKSGKSLPPVVIGSNGVLKNGHHRLQAHLAAGATTIPAIVED